MNARTASELDGQGVTSSDQQQLWTARLVLPVLSQPEILALQDPTGKGKDQWAPKVRLKARRLAVWIIAHRLGLEGKTVAYKAIRRSAAQDFEGWPNPIEAFLK